MSPFERGPAAVPQPGLAVNPNSAQAPSRSGLQQRETPRRTRRQGGSVLTCGLLLEPHRSPLTRLPRVPSPGPTRCVPPHHVGQTYAVPGATRSPFLQYRPRFSPDEPRADALIGSARQVGPTRYSALALLASCCHSAHRVSPASLNCRACQALKVQRFPSKTVPTRYMAPSRSRSNRRIRSPAISGIAVSARRDSQARDLPGSILHHATE